MSKLKISFSLILFLFIVGISSESALAVESVFKSGSLNQEDGTPIQSKHGQFMNNPGSCAFCHQTNTSTVGSISFRDNIYQTCISCHDGTLGFYNVFSQDNSAGTFGGTTEGNRSVHMVENGNVLIASAPGGNRNALDGHWTEILSCVSCHSPHGSHSDRLLNENPNNMADTPIKDGGQKIENVPVVDRSTLKDSNTKLEYADQTYSDASGSNTANYIVYRFKIGETGAPANADYAAKGLRSGDTVLQVMKWDGSKYIIDQSPWLRNYDFDTAFTKHYSTAFYDEKTNYSETYSDLAWVGKPKEMFDMDQLGKGVVIGAGFAGIILDTANYPDSATLTAIVNTLTSGKIARIYVVKLDVEPSSYNGKVTNATSLWTSVLADGSTNPRYKPGRGIALSTFCAACHTDYMASSGNVTGTFERAYRHTTTSDAFTCLRCHFPHGTDVTVMRDAQGKNFDEIMSDKADYPFTGATDRAAAVKKYLMDTNKSSKLKRYTNSSVCLACHGSSLSGITRN